jgi:hypothetical protein
MLMETIFSNIICSKKQPASCIFYYTSYRITSMSESLVEKLKAQNTVSREDIATLLSSVGEPGKKRKEKVEAVQSLNRSNGQGYGVEQTLESYSEF